MVFPAAILQPRMGAARKRGVQCAQAQRCRVPDHA
jgi:hypothetical protein